MLLPLVNQNGYAVFSTRAGLQCSGACFQSAAFKVLAFKVG
ncbi:Uncharacterized protein AC500_2393 [Pseudomonas amygdali pv. lachrymans]|nr:Uncharacterized protein AC505_1333 [Pseudomonas syringae pv. maculicola]KPB97821.1 Uncharacterized protein AC503_2137 [Pseudomonas syringae pv. maculicola]KPC10071.1 Uncharacterized protein AC500_2393 [Pseudomonas amygdali pv. lachrymans]